VRRNQTDQHFSLHNGKTADVPVSHCKKCVQRRGLRRYCYYFGFHDVAHGDRAAAIQLSAHDQFQEIAVLHDPNKLDRVVFYGEVPDVVEKKQPGRQLQ